MSVYSYKKIVDNARFIKRQVENEYDYTLTDNWVYYVCKALLKPHTDIKGIGIKTLRDKTAGTHISRQVKKDDYLDMCRRVVQYVENNRQIPATVKYGKYWVNIRLFNYICCYLLVHYDKEGRLKNQVNINSKYFVKPTEPSNKVLAYFKEKTGINLKYIDDFCDWCKNKVTYEFYFDDKKSNKEVIDSKAGNCTDLTQLAVNIGVGLGYEWKAIHVKCNQSGTGHIYPMFRKKGVNNGNWFIRDVACIASESRYCIWCEAESGGSLLDVNPSWFLESLHK